MTCYYDIQQELSSESAVGAGSWHYVRSCLIFCSDSSQYRPANGGREGGREGGGAEGVREWGSEGGREGVGEGGREGGGGRGREGD